MSVVLRAIRESDLPEFVRWLNDPEVTAFTIREFEGVTLEAEREWFAAKTAPECRDRCWTIEVDGRAIGNCELHVDETGQAAFWGIVIGEKELWSKGYGTAATREALRIGFCQMGLQRVYLHVGSHNPRGMRCYAKAGFRQEEVRPRARLKRGEWIDVVVMAIGRDEWEERANRCCSL